MLAYGTKIAAGVSPGKGGQNVHGVPVYNSVSEATAHHKIDASILFVPARYAKDSAFEALQAGIKLLVVLPEHIPVHDTMAIMELAACKGATVIGPNSFGLVSSGKSKIGIMPNQYFVPGPVGVVSRSGTLSYEIVGSLADVGIGTSTFEKDPDTRVVVLVGEIGGTAEEDASSFIAGHMSKPVIAYLAGKSAPTGKRMGHAGAIIERGMGTLEGKIKALNQAGVKVASLPFEVPDLVKMELEKNPSPSKV